MVTWRSRERGIIVNVDILGSWSCGIEPVFKGFSVGVCHLLCMWGNVGFGTVACMF